MKTLYDIKLERENLYSEIKQLELTDEPKNLTKAKRSRVKLIQLKEYQMYLETNPSEEYLKKEVKRIENLLSAIDKLYILPKDHEKLTKGILSKLRKPFDDTHGVPKLKKQLAALKYLLN